MPLTSNLHELIESSPFGAYILNSKNEFVYVSDKFCTMLGLSRTLILENPEYAYHAVYSDDIETVRDSDYRAKKAGIASDIEFRIVVNGRIRWHWKHCEPHHDENGEGFWFGYIVDINEKKTKELESEEQNIRYQTFISISNTGAWEYDVKNDRLWFSDEYLSMLGLDAYEYRTKHGEKIRNWIDLMHPNDKDKASTKFKNYYSNPADIGIYENYFRIRHQNGNWVWIWSRGQKMFDADGNYLNKVIGTHIDISKSKQREEELQNSQLRYKISADYSLDWDFWRAPDGKYEYVSPGCFEISGYESHEFISDPNLFEKILHPEDLNRWKKHYKLQNDGSPYSRRKIELRIYNKNGSIKWVENDYRAVFDDRGTSLGQRGVNRNITQRKEADKLSQKLLKGIHHNPATILITDIEGNLEYANPRFQQTSGYSVAEVIGTNPWNTILDDPEAILQMEIWETIKEGKECCGEIRSRKRTGEIYYEYTIITPIEDHTGAISNFIAIKEDITIRKIREEELKQANEKLELQNKQLMNFNYITSHVIRAHAANIAGLITEIQNSEVETHDELMHALEQVSADLLKSFDTLVNINNLTD
ncbi:MAG: PAS domain-containing protein [Balneolales bacterium]|nr:PAS domain-containing protein [Balneolales bacterium]